MFQFVFDYQLAFLISLLILLLFTVLWYIQSKKFKKERRNHLRHKEKLTHLNLQVKELQEKLTDDINREGSFADAIPQIVWECDIEGNFYYLNRQWFMYTGLDFSADKDDLWMKTLHPEDRHIMTSKWIGYIKGDSFFEQEFRLRGADGQYQWFLIQGLPLKNDMGVVMKWVGTCTNIEEQKNYHILLENKIQERTLQLQESNNELIRSNKELENFAYVASHDLQEPLRKIRAFGDILKKRYSTDLPEQASEYIDRMQKASYRMQKLIDDLLSYSRVSRTPKLSEPVDLNELVEEVVDDLEETIRIKHAEVKYADLPKIMGDHRQLKQLFQNLISNGIKFHKPDLAPIVEIKQQWLQEVETKTNNGQNLELRFSDNGIGFDEQYHDKIFTIFQRLHGRSAYEGTGIGLAICKKIVENHGGKLYAQSEPGTGSEFVVILPYVEIDQKMNI